MQKIEHILDIYQKRGAQGLPLERVYRQLFNPDFYLLAYSKLYANHGAMTPGRSVSTAETTRFGKAVLYLLGHEAGSAFNPPARCFPACR